MRKLWFGALTCCGIVIALCYTAIFIGYRLPEGQFIPEISSCGGSICYMGIVPGITPWDDGIASIKQNPQLKMIDNSEKLYRHSKPNYTLGLISGVAMKAQFNTFIEIVLNFGSSNILAGEVIKRLGPPCFVAALSDGIGLVFHNASFFIPSKTNRLMLTAPMIYIALHPQRETCPNQDINDPLATYKWHGFGSYPYIPN